MYPGFKTQDITSYQKESTNVKFSYGGLSYECPLHEILVAKVLLKIGADSDLIIKDIALDEFEQVSEGELRFRGLVIESSPDIIELILYSVEHEELGSLNNLFYHFASQRKDYVCIVHTEQDGSSGRITNPYIAYTVNAWTKCTFLADEGFLVKDNNDNTVTISAKCDKLTHDATSGDYLVYSVDKDAKLSKDIVLSWLLNQRLVPVVSDKGDAKGSNISHKLHIDLPVSKLHIASTWLLDVIIESGNICLEKTCGVNVG